MKRVITIILIMVLLVPINIFAKTQALDLENTLKDEKIEVQFSDYKETDDQVIIYLFRGAGCSHCHDFLEFLNGYANLHRELFKLRSFEVYNNPDNATLKKKIAEYFGDRIGGVPYIIIGDKTFYGFAKDGGSEIEEAIKEEYNKSERFDIFKVLEQNENNITTTVLTTKKNTSSKTPIAEIIVLVVVIVFVVLMSCSNLLFKQKKKVIRKVNSLLLFTFFHVLCKIKMVNNMGKAKKYITKHNAIKIVLYVIGLFAASLAYNHIFVPNNIVVGGASGLAVVLKEITGISTTILIDIMNVLLVILSFIFLSKEETFRQLVGCVCFPLMVTLTAQFHINLNINDMALKFLIGAVTYGVSLGLIYRAGFSTGGFDIFSQILSNKTKKPFTIISPIINALVLLAGYIVFNPVQIMCSLVIIFVSNRIINKVLFSISSNKMVYIMSNKDNMTDYITDNFHLGVTEFKINKELIKRKKNAILVIVHNTKYDVFKKSVLTLDPKATLITKRCYEVTGGSRIKILPF